MRKKERNNSFSSGQRQLEDTFELLNIKYYIKKKKKKKIMSGKKENKEYSRNI